VAGVVDSLSDDAREISAGDNAGFLFLYIKKWAELDSSSRLRILDTVSAGIAAMTQRGVDQADAKAMHRYLLLLGRLCVAAEASEQTPSSAAAVVAATAPKVCLPMLCVHHRSWPTVRLFSGYRGAERRSRWQ
jgi:hypothetical protein